MKLIQLCLLVIGIQLLPVVIGAQSLDFYYSPSRGTVVIDYDYLLRPLYFWKRGDRHLCL
jgi:hypothetical protein